jgi:hypothetical protein
MILFSLCGKKTDKANVTEINETAETAIPEATEQAVIEVTNLEQNNYSEIRIQYIKPINGFKVNVSFYPEYYEKSDKTLHGGACFEFVSPKGIRDTMYCDMGIYFYVNNFPELTELLKDTIYHNCRNLPKLPVEKVFYLDYKEPVIKDIFRLSDFDVPFYFVDANFDGEKDLLIRSSILFYDCKILTNGEINAELTNAINIDFQTDTRIDTKNKEIITYNGYYNDLCLSIYEFYKFNDKGKIYLSKVQENDIRDKKGLYTDSTRITTFQYQWVNGVWTNKGKEEKIVRSEK